MQVNRLFSHICHKAAVHFLIGNLRMIQNLPSRILLKLWMIFSRNKLRLSIKFDTSIKQLLKIYLLLDNNTNKIEKKAENLDTLYLKK